MLSSRSEPKKADAFDVAIVKVFVGSSTLRLSWTLIGLEGGAFHVGSDWVAIVEDTCWAERTALA